MKKKFEKISPKDISETKFQELLNALPSLKSNMQDSQAVAKNENDILQTDKSLSQVKLKKNDISSNDEEALSISSYSENVDLFVYEVGKNRFGIPVTYVTEITNDYGPLSNLEGLIRSCLGTFSYRGRLLPLFDSEAAHLRLTKEKAFEERSTLGSSEIPIITVECNDIMFALTMQNHVGIVSVKLIKSNETQRVDLGDYADEFIDEIVWYNNKNLFIFSPQKIAHVVERELKHQIAADFLAPDHDNNSLLSNADNTKSDYMIAKVNKTFIAVEITNVLEVIEGFEVTGLYKVTDFLRGLINLRGQVLACIDLSKFLGYQLLVLDERNKFIVLRESGSDFALCVNEVLGIETLDSSEFQKTSAVFPDDVSKFFPSFFDENDAMRLVFKPDLFIKAENLNDYRKQNFS